MTGERRRNPLTSLGRQRADRNRSRTAAAGLIAVLAALVLPRWTDVVGFGVAATVILPLLWLALWTAACLGAGHLALAALRPGPGGSGRPPLAVALATGAAALALVAFAAATCGLLTPVVVILVLAASAVAGAVRLVENRGRIHRPPLWGVLTIALLTTPLLLTLPAPPVMYDTLAYHLAFPAQWLQAHRFVAFPRHDFSYFSAATGMLYTYALATVGPWGAKAIHLWLGAVAVLGAATLAARAGGRRAGWLTAVILASTPLVLEIATYAIADLAVAAWAAAALLVATQPRLDRRSWLLAGLLAGSAAGAKYLAVATVWLPVVAAALVATVRSRRDVRRLPTAGLLFGAGAAIAFAPWLIRNAVWTGNPVFPFLRGLFGGPAGALDVAGVASQGSPIAPNVLDFVHRVATAPVARTFDPLQVGSVLGPQWLILLPAALLLPRLRRRSLAPLWAAVVVGVLAWASLVQFGRFLLPALIAAAALIGVAAAVLTRRSSAVAVRSAVVLLLGLIVLWNASTEATALNLDRAAVTLGLESGDELLSTHASYWPAVEDANELVDGRLLLVGEGRTLYLEVPVVVEDPYHTPLLAEVAEGARAPADIAERLRTLGISHLLVNRVEMERIARMRGLSSYWADLDPDGERRLAIFFRDWVDWVGGASTCALGRLRTAANATSPPRTARDGRAGPP